MFTKAEEALIQELKEQNAPLERWAKFFPQHKIVDLMEKSKPLYYYLGEPVYRYDPRHFFTNPCSEIPCDPAAYAKSKKKGNIYMWDDLQDAYLAELANKAYTNYQIRHYMKERFGIERTIGAINSRLSLLGFIAV